jgi:carboxymethylenebutenolidase
MDENIRRHAIELYDAFTHDGRDRRSFLREVTLLAGSAAAAEALIASIAASPAAAAMVPADDKRLKTRTERWDSAPDRAMSAYIAEPAKGRARPLIVVVHENRGLNEHIRDVTRRVALAGYRAVAPDLLTPVGGTPDDQDKARAMIGALDLAGTVQDAQSVFTRFGGGRKTGVTGFCWGQGGGAADDPLARARHPRGEHGAPVRGGAQGRKQAGHAARICRRQSCVQQRHVCRTLRRGRGQARLGADNGLFPGQLGLTFCSCYVLTDSRQGNEQWPTS